MTCPVPPPPRDPQCRRDERAVVAGADGLLFGVLVLVAGTVLVVNLWSAVASRWAADAAAREYLRAWTAAPSGDRAEAQANLALRRSLDGSGIDPARVHVDGPDPAAFGACAPAEVIVQLDVPAVRAPFLGELGRLRVTAHHAELVPPHRELVAGTRFDPAGTPCGG